MEEVNGYNITRKEYKKLSELAEKIYYTAIVINLFCSNRQEIYELHNLPPVVKNFLNEADLLNVFFINREDD